jgi:pyrophosphatase PpaX
MSNPITVALFDWDGTLVDTGGVLLACWHQATEEVLGEKFPTREEDRRRVLAMRAAESFPTLTDDPTKVAELARAFDASYEVLAPQHVRAQPGAAALLRELRDAGIRTGLVTSKTTIRRDLDGRLAGLDPLLECIVTGDDVKRGKPDPEGILRAMAQLGGAPDTTAYIGDGPVDIHAGHAAGVRTIAISHGLHDEDELIPTHPDFLVTSLDQVAGALR